MGPFLPGPGPLTTAPHPQDATTTVADAWACTVQPTLRVPNYRGSYSAIMGAADEAIPSDSTDWASNATSRSTPFYRPPTRPPILVADNPTAVLDAWADTTFGRSVPYYKGPGAVTISVWDPATNTFADWTPTALLSRSVANYKPPATQPQVAWGQSIVTDQTAPLAVSRPSRLYAPQRSLTIPVWDPATNTFADWTPQPALSRSVPLFRSPASFLASVYDQPAVIFGTDWASVTQNRRAPFRYLGSPSLTIPVYDLSTIVAGDPGGGGFGAVMDRAFFERYHAGYEAAYAPRYQPTIRKQKR